MWQHTKEKGTDGGITKDSVQELYYLFWGTWKYIESPKNPKEVLKEPSYPQLL